MEEPPKPHNWEHRGLQTLPRNGSKFDPWLKAFLSFLCGALSAAFFLGGKSRDISDLQSWKASTDIELKGIATRFERMEREGTNRSHWVDDSQSNQISANQTKIADIEHRMEQRGEQINVMQVKIEKLEREIEDKRK